MTITYVRSSDGKKFGDRTIKEPLKTYSVDKNIPLPRKGPWKYDFPWEDMDIGDSFVVESAKEALAAGTRAKALDIQITTRKEGTSYRVWRLSK